MEENPWRTRWPFKVFIQSSLNRKRDIAFCFQKKISPYWFDVLLLSVFFPGGNKASIQVPYLCQMFFVGLYSNNAPPQDASVEVAIWACTIQVGKIISLIIADAAYFCRLYYPCRESSRPTPSGWKDQIAYFFPLIPLPIILNLCLLAFDQVKCPSYYSIWAHHNFIPLMSFLIFISPKENL